MDYLKNIFLYQDNSPLLFTQFYFWNFFLILLIGYSLIYTHNRIRNIYLFIASLFFYYKSGGYFFSLLIFSTLVDYYMGQAIYQSKSRLNKKIFISISLLANLGLLAYFKYTYFFIDILNFAPNQIISFCNTHFGFSLPLMEHHFQVVNYLAVWTNQLSGSNFAINEIILPVGISFYTFQTISYSIDIYRKKIKPVNNIIDFGFYVSFFPQLVAGPIVRAHEFIPQLYKKYRINQKEFSEAIILIINGLIKKMLISDYLSINFVDRVFDNPQLYSGFENLTAVYGYAVQIYCDFSGYTDIAIGIALLLGFRLPLNFNSPYKARNITDFWRRWHISLSRWLKDYLYISLGGNRKGKFRTYLNLMLTMLLGGLWHGASVRFILWGGLHGLGLVVHKLWMKYTPFRSINNKPIYQIITAIVTFHFVCLGWILFRAGDMIKIQQIFNQIFNQFNFHLIFDYIQGYMPVFLMLIFGLTIHLLPRQLKKQYQILFIKSNYLVKAVYITLIIFIIYQAKSSNIQPFIYFQF